MSSPEFGLEFLRCCAQDDRLRADDLREIISFACSSYAGDLDDATRAKAEHSAKLLAKGFAASRGSRDLEELSYRFAKYPTANVQSNLNVFEKFRRREGESAQAHDDRIKATIAEEERAPAKPDAQANAAAILRADAIARGEIRELPEGSNAMAILRAHRKATDPDKPL